MHEFRDRKLPIDSVIMDYDWFGWCNVPIYDKLFDRFNTDQLGRSCHTTVANYYGTLL
jgi:hypothetical protein